MCDCGCMLGLALEQARLSNGCDRATVASGHKERRFFGHGIRRAGMQLLTKLAAWVARGHARPT